MFFPLLECFFGFGVHCLFGGQLAVFPILGNFIVEVFVVKDGQVIGRGWNCVTSTRDPTAHAEVMAIRDACNHLGTFDLSGCEIYSSCEPCPMCLAAIYWARIDTVYYAATREDAAAAGFDDAFIYDEVARDPGGRTIAHHQLTRSSAHEVLLSWKALSIGEKY